MRQEETLTAAAFTVSSSYFSEKLAAELLGAVLAARKVYRYQYCEVTDEKEPARTSGRTDIRTVKSGFVLHSTFRKLLIKADVARHSLCQGSLFSVQYRRSA